MRPQTLQTLAKLAKFPVLGRSSRRERARPFAAPRCSRTKRSDRDRRVNMRSASRRSTPLPSSRRPAPSRWKNRLTTAFQDVGKCAQSSDVAADHRGVHGRCDPLQSRTERTTASPVSGAGTSYRVAPATLVRLGDLSELCAFLFSLVRTGSSREPATKPGCPDWHCSRNMSGRVEAVATAMCLVSQFGCRRRRGRWHSCLT